MSACYLVDTCTLLWAISASDRLSDVARSLINDSSNRILVSHASLWELSIKVSIGKIQLPETFFDSLTDFGYEMLPIREEHFAAYRELPLLHRDPFDRLLVAQAQAERIALLSSDAEIARYEVNKLW